ncbi:hypothetical protein [uncultured Litoreibacter sp.]|uniref:Flp family type IVb pilin n=1 Tax=uncultured Litoreibacter sp. TaxID=1392394 RepID=UPI0026211315|nr:hypothetical protein [uncultured Litoreibacter sp.]
MYTKMINAVRNFRTSEDGATLVEYGIALTLAITLGTGALVALSGNVGTSMSDAGAALPTAAPVTD